MKIALILTIVLAIQSFSYGFVIPLQTAMKKSVALTGNQIFSVDQDVIFKSETEDVVIKENWLIEGDKNLILTATGQGAMKDSFKAVIVYNSKNKTSIIGKNRVTEVVNSDFFERYLSIRSVASFANYLNDLGIAKAIRLSRVGGAPGLAIGEPSTNVLKPQIWLDQETFQIRKIRFPSETEITFDDYAQYDKIWYPRLKTVNWGHQSATIRVRQVSTKVKANLTNFYPQKLDQPTEINLANKGQIGLTIQEFYTRFR